MSPQTSVGCTQRIHDPAGDAENESREHFNQLPARRHEQLVEINGHINFYAHELEIQSKQDATYKRLQEIPGYGPIISSAFYSVVGDGRTYVLLDRSKSATHPGILLQKFAKTL